MPQNHSDVSVMHLECWNISQYFNCLTNTLEITLLSTVAVYCRGQSDIFSLYALLLDVYYPPVLNNDILVDWIT